MLDFSQPDGWNYKNEVKKWVDNGMNIYDRRFIDGVSGIVNRGTYRTFSNLREILISIIYIAGCHDAQCGTGAVLNNKARSDSEL
jgi:hypothetical protein